MISVLVTADIPLDRRYLFDEIDGLEITYDSDTAKVTDYPDTEVIVGNVALDKIPEMKKLRWIQLNFAGANLYSNIGDIILTNASGGYGLAISEYMLGAILMIMKKFPQYHQLQKQHVYRGLGEVGTIFGSTAVIVGAGDIGGNLARRLKALGCRIIGVRRKVHDRPDYIDELVSFADIDKVLPMGDIVALSLPETRETVGLFDRDRLVLMKKGSILVNVGRGSAIVTEDLIPLVKENHFLGVMLDVHEKEPLPADSELWDLENVYITPHVSGGFLNTQQTIDLVIDICVRNLRHYVKGEALEHVVDKSIGY